MKEKLFICSRQETNNLWSSCMSDYKELIEEYIGEYDINLSMAEKPYFNDVSVMLARIQAVNMLIIDELTFIETCCQCLQKYYLKKTE